MKKGLILALVVASLSANTINVKQHGTIFSYEYAKQENTYTLSNKKFFDSNVKIIIEFSEKSKKDDIEQKYRLLNGKVFYGNLFIYEQNENNLVELFDSLSKEQDILNVYPNWITIHKKY